MDSLSICIPTNRGKENLEKCLISIKNADKPKNFKFNVCISDNSLDFSKIKLVKKFKKNFQINYKFSQKKTNRVTNMIESVNLSNYDFIWLLGDDEILSKKSFINLYKIFTNKKKEIDFIFLNSSFIKGKETIFTYKHLNKNKRGNIFQNNEDIDFSLSKMISNNDYLMIKGSNATGLNDFSKKMIKGL